MSILRLTVRKDGSITYPKDSPQIRAIDTEQIKLVYLGDAEECYPIVDTSLTINAFAIGGDYSSQFLNGKTVTITGSTGNDGDYTVNGDASYDGTNTVIRVTETIPDSTNDGTICVDTLGARVIYYDDQDKSLRDILVEEGVSDIAEDASTLISLTVEKIDNKDFDKTALIQTEDSIVYITQYSSDTTKSIITYDFGERNHAEHSELLVDATIEEIQDLMTDPQRYRIVDANLTLDVFAIAGDYTDLFPNGTAFTVAGSTCNNGAYTTDADATFDGANTII